MIFDYPNPMCSPVFSTLVPLEVEYSGTIPRLQKTIIDLDATLDPAQISIVAQPTTHTIRILGVKAETVCRAIQLIAYPSASLAD